MYGVDVAGSSAYSVLPFVVTVAATNAAGWIADGLVNNKVRCCCCCAVLGAWLGWNAGHAGTRSAAGLPQRLQWPSCVQWHCTPVQPCPLISLCTGAGQDADPQADAGHCIPGPRRVPGQAGGRPGGQPVHAAVPAGLPRWNCPACSLDMDGSRACCCTCCWPGLARSLPRAPVPQRAPATHPPPAPL